MYIYIYIYMSLGKCYILRKLPLLFGSILIFFFNRETCTTLEMFTSDFHNCFSLFLFQVINVKDE